MAEERQDLIGLSLSGCIRDIALGLVPIGRVKMIVAGTNWSFPDDLDKAVDRYTYMEWRGHSCARAAEVLRELVAAGKIIQPRNYGYDSHNISAGRWARQFHIDIGK